MRGMILSGVLIGCLTGFLVACPAAAQSVDGLSGEEVETATNLATVKTNLALCAPQLEGLRAGPDPAAFARDVQDPECRQAIVAAQAAGLSKAQIVDILMGASGVTDPNAPTIQHGGPPRVE